MMTFRDIIPHRTRLSYDFSTVSAIMEPDHTTFMVCSGGGWIVTGLVMKDRF